MSEYKHLKDELATNEKTNYYFKSVEESANEYSLKLSDDEFKRFFKLRKNDKDISWLMHKMSTYNLDLADALISYICY